jgi:hypothetical protein
MAAMGAGGARGEFGGAMHPRGWGVGVGVFQHPAAMGGGVLV